MPGKRHCSLFCSPQPIARFIQLFPKLAIVFLVIHLTVIIYSFLSPSPHATRSKDIPPGVVDDKIKLVGNHIGMNKDMNGSDDELFYLRHDILSPGNKTKSLLLQKLNLDSIHIQEVVKDPKRQVNLHKRSPER